MMKNIMTSPVNKLIPLNHRPGSTWVCHFSLLLIVVWAHKKTSAGQADAIGLFIIHALIAVSYS
ncbi:hypothetical protein A3860_02380 [Niastella vici]|uniref:Uncharacterized protein n=1 Tax=Niastella vici TaxID=1703345 RepID=A0A1V9G9H7_9BACT|nr:hypothetical protein A3860_02380 [Niastella vici]